MPRFAEPVSTRSAKQTAGRQAAAPQARRAGPKRGPLWHAIQLKAAQSAAPGRSGLPGPLQAGVERLSGIAMDDVRVHRNSAEPAKLGALAYTQGRDIHLGPGQERHLPHEAWHVVQQKQGRVQATAQLKGVALNGGVSRRGVVQAKLRIFHTILEDKNLKDDPVPQRLLAYHQSDKIYQIRDDWSADFKDPIHLISPDHVYLLGEIHKTSKWEEQIKGWGHVDKMAEARKSFPGIATEKHDPQDQPLESMHAFLLHTALYARSMLMSLQAGKEAVPSAATVDDYLWAIGQILASKSGYLRLGKAIVADKSDKTYEAETKFLENLTTKHLNNAEIAKVVATKLKADIAIKNPDGKVLAEIKELKDLLVGEAGALTALAIDVAAVIGIAPNTVKGKAIAAEASSKVAVAPAASAAMSVREAAMAANINAAKRPLLVQVGDGHVESLGGLVAKSVKVRANDSLAKHTLV